MKSAEAENACTMFTQCQEQLKAMENSGGSLKGLKNSLKTSRENVDRHVGNYIREYHNLDKDLSEGCKILSNVLEEQPKKVESEKPGEDRDKVLQDALEEVSKWANDYETLCKTSDQEANEALLNLCKGMKESASLLETLNEGKMAGPESQIAPVEDLIVKSHLAFSRELTLLTGKNPKSGYGTTMKKLCAAIQVCINMKLKAKKTVDDYKTVLELIKKKQMEFEFQNP